jgi:tetratricopeptide (TPR) repeat protein
MVLGLPSAAYGQAERFGSTPAEYRAVASKVASLEGDLAGLSKRYGVPMTTMRAIARGQLRALPALGAGPLRETVTKLAGEAATLRAQIRTLQDRVRDQENRLPTVSGSSSRSDLMRMAADLRTASAAIDAGELQTARTTLSRIAPEAAEIGATGTDLWTEIVKASALLDYVAGDMEGSDAALKRASRLIMGQATDKAWELEQERGERLLDYGERTQDVRLIARASTVLASEALPLTRSDDVRRVRTLGALCLARISPFLEDLTSQTWEVQRRRLPELISTCEAAATSAASAEGAPNAGRSTAMSRYALALSLRYLFEGADRDMREAAEWLNRAKRLADQSGEAETIISSHVLAGDVIAMGYAVDRKRKSLDDAIAEYQQALKLLDRSTAPTDWAAAQQRIGSMYLTLHLDEHDRGPLVLADRHLSSAMLVFTPTFSKVAWARVAASRAEVRGRLGMADRDRSVVERSIAELRTAISVLAEVSANQKAEAAERTLAEFLAFTVPRS